MNYIYLLWPHKSAVLLIVLLAVHTCLLYQKQWHEVSCLKALLHQDLPYVQPSNMAYFFYIKRLSVDTGDVMGTEDSAEERDAGGTRPDCRCRCCWSHAEGSASHAASPE